jgi:tyrosine phenol-lyase
LRSGRRRRRARPAAPAGDLDKLARVIDEEGAERIPYVSIACTVNMAGGQPVSMTNLRAVRELCDARGVKAYLDRTRIAENAWFVQQREEGDAERSIGAIVREVGRT